MSESETDVAGLVRRGLVAALGLDLPASELRGDQALYEHPISMDSLGFHRVLVEIEIQLGSTFDEAALAETLFETVDDLTTFVSRQTAP